MTFTGNVADVLSDAEYRALVGRSYTGCDVVVFTPVTTGVNTALVACYDVPHKIVRAIQVGTPQNITMDVRFARKSVIDSASGRVPVLPLVPSHRTVGVSES